MTRAKSPILHRLPATLALGFAVLLGTYAPSRAQATVDAARAALPEAIRSAGVLKTATSYQWPPFASKGENGEPDGIDIRLIKLLSAKLGLKPVFEDMKFPAIVPSVSNGRYDVGVNQMATTPERRKVVDFVPYINTGFGLLVRRGSTALDVNHLCGRSLSLTQGSSQVAVAERLSARCKQAGEPEIATLFFPNSADTYLAVSNGRGDGFITGTAVGVYIAGKNANLEMTPKLLEGARETAGIVIGKGNAALHEALRLAMESALADGSYAQILSDFGVPDAAVTRDQLRDSKATN
jgi:polar amino acid transport system substrate-binding protein